MDFQSPPPPPPPPRLVYLDPPPPPPAPDHHWSQPQDQVHHDQEHGSVGSMAARARLAKLPPPEAALKCPRCESTNTKFCYFNNYSLTQPRHFCKTCRRYWTRGGALRNVPVGGGCRRRSSNGSGKNTHKRKRGGSKSPITNSKPNYNNISISGDILENFLTQSTHPPILPPADPLSDHHEYNLPADIYDPAAGAGSLGILGSSAGVGFILGNRFHNISEQWMRGQAQFPYMDPNPVVASEIVDDHHPLMKVELGSVGLNLLGSSTHDHDDQYWAAGGNDNVMMMNNNSNNLASSAWTDHHLSRFVHMTSSSSTPTTHDLLM